MSGYQGKKNIPRITVSLGVIQTLQRRSSCSIWSPGPAGCHRGGEDHAPRPHPPLPSSALLSSELKGLQLTQQLSSCIIRCILLFAFFARPNLLETGQPIGSALRPKSDGHLQHLADRSETRTRSNRYIFFFIFTFIGHFWGRFFDLYVRFCSWSVCSGASRPVVFVRRCVWEPCVTAQQLVEQMLPCIRLHFFSTS